jgi:hypothetical protein
MVIEMPGKPVHEDREPVFAGAHEPILPGRGVHHLTELA